MRTDRVVLLAHLLACHLATDAPPVDPTSGHPTPSIGTDPTFSGHLTPEYPSSHSTHGDVDHVTNGYVVQTSGALSRGGVMLRLGNSTLDSTKSFRVPQATIVELDHVPTRIPPIFPHVVAAGVARRFDHHDRLGPSFEGSDGNTSRVTVQLGEDASLNCRISLLQDKTVSWMRRRGGGVPELLTVGAHTYAADDRVSVTRRYPGNWKLDIRSVRSEDEGIYECQISTHPPRVSRTHLHVNTPQVWVVDEAGAPLLEKYYEAESTLALTCRARDVDTPVSLTWLYQGRDLYADTTRGGISIRTEQLARGADSTLRLARVNASDAGNYTCAVRGARPHTVSVHVLNEESLAELHAGVSSTVRSAHRVSLAFVLPFFWSRSSSVTILTVFIGLVTIMLTTSNKSANMPVSGHLIT